MRNMETLIKHFMSVSAGLTVLFWTMYLMISPMKFALGPVLFLIAFSSVELLLSGSSDTTDTQSNSRFPVSSKIFREIAIAIAFVICLATILSVPAIKGEVFLEWTTLGMPSIVRLIATFSMNFFPGYIILKIVGNRELGKLSRLITSYLLSLFVLTITAFISARIFGIVDEVFLSAFLLICGALILAYTLKLLLRQKPRSVDKNGLPLFFANHKTMLPNLLVGLTVVFIGTLLFWAYSNIGFFLGSAGSDMWRLHGAAQTYLDFRAFNLLYYPWWFDLYVSGFTVLSGVPTANAYLALYPLIALPALSFYLMASAFFKEKRIPSLATLSYAIFSGPAWFYALYLRDFSPLIGSDEWKSILYEASNKFLLQGRYTPFPLGFTGAAIGYASLWWLVYATLRLDVKSKHSFLLISIAFALSYLTHGVEPVIFVLYLFSLLIVCRLTHNKENRKRIGWAAMAVLVGLGIVALIDLSLTPQYNYFNSLVPNPNALVSTYFYFNSPSFYLLIFASALLIVLARTWKPRSTFTRLRQTISRKLVPKYSESLKRRLPELVFYFYGLTLVVFIISFPSLTITQTLFGSVPWYVYPILGGVPSLLGLTGIVIASRKWNELETKFRITLLFCALSVFLLFVFGQAISFINERFFYTHFWERRTFAYVVPVMSLLMAYALVNLFSRVLLRNFRSVKHIGKIVLVTLLTSVLIIGSVSSTLIAADFASIVFFVDRPTNDELEALRYLHYSLPMGEKTGYVNQRTGRDYIRAFANDKWTSDSRLWLGRYSSPTYVLSAISQADIQHLYLNRIRDSGDLERNLFIQQLIRVLPVEFNNSEVTIYSIPPLRFSSPLASLGLISPEETAGAAYDAYTLWYTTLVTGMYEWMEITNTSDPDVLSSAKDVLVPYDPLPVKNETRQLLDWVNQGGHLIVSNTNEFGVSSELFGLRTKTPLVNCDSTDNWRTVYGTRGTISVEGTVKVEGAASLRLQNNFSSWEGYIYNPQDPWNLTRYEYLGIWVYGTGGGPLFYLKLTDTNDSEAYYRLDLSTYDPSTREYFPSFIGWKLILIPITEHYSSLNLSAIKRLKIETGFTMPVDILIDEVFAVEEVQERRSVRIDGIEAAATITLPEITVRSLSPSVDTRVIANYTRGGATVTPFAIQRDFGSGKITYLNINSLYNLFVYGSDGFAGGSEVLVKILELLEVSLQS